MAESPGGKKPGSGKKRSQSARSNSALEEIKRQGRRLRSAMENREQVEGGGFQFNEGLTSEQLLNQPKGVGLVYDEDMLRHECQWDPKHPECPARLQAAYERCQHYGLVERCTQIPSRVATPEEVLLGHSKEYYEDVLQQQISMTNEQLKEHSAKFDGIYFDGASTMNAAKLALGSTLEAVKAIHTGQVRNAMALVRPPGHHAMEDKACGYCFLNSVSLAAKHAVSDLGYKRVLIVDWDVHHGQGTQYMHYEDPRVLYFSIHRFEHGAFWPNLRESQYDAVGQGEGLGYNVNVPLNATGMTNGDYLAVFTQLLLPIAYQFDPELILVSSGYDAAIGCPEGENEVTPTMYAHFINLLKPLADGKLCVVLEGGYCIKSLAEGVALTLRALLDDPCPAVGPLQPPCESMVASILNTISALRPYWSCLRYQGTCEEDEFPDILERHQSPGNIEFANEENQPAVNDIYGDYIIHTKEKEEELNEVIDGIIKNTELATYLNRNLCTESNPEAPYPVRDCYPTLDPKTVAAFDKHIEGLIDTTCLDTPANRTCLVYDERMRKHKATTMDGHPERPDRIKRIYDKHRECGLLDRCKQLPSRAAVDEELELVHDRNYIEQVRGFSELGPRELLETEYSFNSIYLSPDVYECATLAAGCTLNVIDEVCSGKSQNGLAIVRPPGHHAERSVCCGFCYFDTVAIAARYAQKHHGVKRVMILDWDVHHGNGVQHAFEDDPSVLYISLHRHDEGFFYPGGDGGDYHQVGKGAGIGFNINIPWNHVTAGDSEYIAAFQHIVLPVAYEFCPELVLVSAGFDAARGDPLGGMDISPEGYGHMTQMLLGLANGKLILVLEGGYNLVSISESMAMCTSVMLGDQCPRPSNKVPREKAVKSICDVLDMQKGYWRCLQFREDIPGSVAPYPDSRAATPERSFLNDFDILSRLSRDLENMKLQVNQAGSDPNPANATESLENSGDVKDDRPESVIQLERSAQEMPCASEEVITVATEQRGGGDRNEESAGDSGACGGATGGAPGGSKGIAEMLGLHGGEELHAVVPLPWCPHLESVQPLPCRGLDVRDECLDCGNQKENWVCLVCYQVHCSRYVNEHMLMHGIETEHRVVLSYADLSVWCYACDSYVHNEILVPAKRAAHISKFDEDVPGL